MHLRLFSSPLRSVCDDQRSNNRLFCRELAGPPVLERERVAPALAVGNRVPRFGKTREAALPTFQEKLLTLLTGKLIYVLVPLTVPLRLVAPHVLLLERARAPTEARCQAAQRKRGVLRCRKWRRAKEAADEGGSSVAAAVPSTWCYLWLCLLLLLPRRINNDDNIQNGVVCHPRRCCLLCLVSLLKGKDVAGGGGQFYD